jgi:hypothetical protein
MPALMIPFALVEYMDGRLAQHELHTQQGQLDPYLQTKH